MARTSQLALQGLAVAMQVMVRLLPVKAASELLAWVMRSIADSVTRQRIIRRNLHAAFPELDDGAVVKMAREISGNLGRLIVEISKIHAFQSGKGGARITARGALDYPFGQRGQAIFVSAHLGNWELIPVLFQRQNLPMTIIHTPLPDASIDDRLMTLRRKTGATYVEKSKALRGCAAALKRGESIALLVDQRVESGIEVEFFGRPTLFTHFPARMACKFNCPIIVGEAVRVAPAEVEVTFHEPIWPNSPDGGDDEFRLTQAMATRLEDSIRRNPDQWFCNKSRWRMSRARSDVPAPQSQMIAK